jgi:predicted PurR-regulated permease PerM
MATEQVIQPAKLAPAPSEMTVPQTWRPRHWAMNVIGIGGILALCYYGESVLVVMLLSVLLAFILAPIVDALTYIRLPRALAAGIALLLLLGALAGVVYYSYNEASALMEDLPKYTNRVRNDIARLRKKAETLEKNAESLKLTPDQKGVLNVRTTRDWTEILTSGFGSATSAILTVSFVPFLVYFMLTWQGHVRSTTVMLFPMQSRHTAYVTLGLISSMIRTFMVGNLLIGLFIGAAGTVVFGLIGLPFFYFVGFVSGFLSLVPYLGVVLALVPPIFVDLGHLHSQELVLIIVLVVGLHLLAMNVLYPKFLGKRLQLNPLAVTMGLLFWGVLWGAMGLLLAIPITAAMKIIFDHVESLKPYGAWLGE